MKSLIEWEEEWLAMFGLHTCCLGVNTVRDWDNEKILYPGVYNNPDVSVTFFDMSLPRVELHICMHSKWLLHEAFDMSAPTNLKCLSNLTHPDDRIFSLETEILGYEILMSLKPGEQSRFWMKYNRRLSDMNGEFIFYSLQIKVFKFDEVGNPWILLVETKRLPKTFEPQICHSRSFSHRIKEKGQAEEPASRKLSKRETEVLELAHEGYTSKEIAFKLGISKHTVKNTRKNYLKKLNVGTTHLAYVVAQKQKMFKS